MNHNPPEPSAGSDRGPRSLAALSLSLLAFSLALAILPAGSGAANPPRITRTEVREIEATRGEFIGSFFAEGVPAQAAVSLATQTGSQQCGSFTTIKEEAQEPRFANTLEADFTGLQPNSGYCARFSVKTANGEDEATIFFKTKPVGPPEFLPSAGAGICPSGRSYEPATLNICGQAGASVADFGFDIYTGGAETHWHVDFAESEAGPWSPVAGAEGTISVAEEEATYHGELSGLTPEHTY